MNATESPKQSKKLKALLSDAQAAGYEVEIGNGFYKISKPYGPHGKRRGLILWMDGTAFDICIQLDIGKGLRSYKSMRKVLRLKTS